MDEQFRVVLDLQGCQTEGSRGRGIGRYSNSLSKALIAEPGPFSISVAVNESYPDSATELAADLGAIIPRDRFIRYAATRPNEPWSATSLDVGRLAGEWIAQFAWLAQKPDLVHVNSVFEGFHGHAVVPELRGMPRQTVVSATAYDVIPLVFADVYLADSRTRSWYMACIDRMRRCDVVLAISEASRRDVIDLLGFAEERVVNILGSVDTRFTPLDLSPGRRLGILAPLGLRQPYVMYTGGIDHRKNVEALIAAFGLLPSELRNRTQLAIVCKVQEGDRIRLARLARLAGLRPDGMVMTGFVHDDILVDLYRCCELFVFPSLYEGFGLPVLEAMSCGAPTIAARTSSLPEVVGREDALFSVENEAKIGHALARALLDDGYRRSLRSHALEQARRFSWAQTADRTRVAWIDAIARKRRRPSMVCGSARPRLALVTPLLPERTGIADFVTELLPHLARRFEIDLFVSENADHGRYRKLGYAVRAWQQLPGCWLEYDAGVLFQFGNSEFHVHMLGLLAICPGTVMLHDAFLSGLFGYSEFGLPRLTGLFAEMLRYCHGDDAIKFYEQNGLEKTIDHFPMARWVADHANGLVVTSRHAWALLDEHDQADLTPCVVIQHHRQVHEVSEADRAEARRALGIPAECLLVCSFGHAHERKLSLELLEAWTFRMPSPNARLVFVGEASGTCGDALRNRLRKATNAASVTIAGYVPDEEFHRYMTAADIVVQLRSGSRGEASGAALYAMAYGAPLITTRHGGLAEFPDDTCLHLALPISVDELADVLSGLASDSGRRREIGARAQEWVRAHCAPDQSVELLAEVVARFNDPAIVHADSVLTMRTRGLQKAMLSGSSHWADEIADRAAQSRSPRAVSEVASSLEQKIGCMIPKSSDLPVAEVNDVDKLPARSLMIAASDSRLLTVCGVKVGGTIRTNGSAGVLVHGPYMAIPAGRYRVRLYGESLAGVEGHVNAEVVAGGGRMQLASIPLGSAPHRLGLLGRLDFTAAEAVTDLEIRVHVDQDVQLVLEGLDLVALS